MLFLPCRLLFQPSEQSVAQQTCGRPRDLHGQLRFLSPVILLVVVAAAGLAWLSIDQGVFVKKVYMHTIPPALVQKSTAVWLAVSLQCTSSAQQPTAALTPPLHMRINPSMLPPHQISSGRSSRQSQHAAHAHERVRASHPQCHRPQQTPPLHTSTHHLRLQPRPGCSTPSPRPCVWMRTSCIEATTSPPAVS